jgi:UV excision repair protein RAD23
LTNGIPEQVEQVAVQPSAGGAPLQNLRNHPQFDDLRRLVQSNPQMLQQVLTQIGQQQPELLQEINANQAVFLQMMNEPISESASAPGPRAISSPASSAGAGGLSPEMMAGMADPTQMAQMMQNMNPQQLQMMANMMGLSPDQLQAVGRMIGQMPPEQLQEYMQQAMQQGGGDGDGGVDDMPSGAHVLRLSEEEMAAVDRLTEMGFDRAEAAQAFLACDKNEALAANLLMDGGFGFGNDDLGGGGGNGDDMDDMYD